MSIMQSALVKLQIIGLDGTVDVSSNGAASKTMSKVQAAINKLSSHRSKLGAIQNRLRAHNR